MNVSKFNLLGEEIEIKDKFLRDKITGLDLTSLAVIGDSNAEGLGWWKEISKKTIKNDGYCAVLRELYPNAIIDNYSVSGSTMMTSDLYLLAQVENMLNSRKEYQHCIIQAGFNDISKFINSGTMFVGECPMDRPRALAINNTNTIINAFCFYVNKIKRALPKCKIHLLIRESQFNESVTQIAYIDMLHELSVACSVIGVDFWNLATDQITSNLENIKEIYYHDIVHWNEKAYREIVTPFIISGLIGYSSCIPSPIQNIKYFGLFNVPSLFSDDSIVPESLKNYFMSLPELYTFTGELISNDLSNCLYSIVKRGEFIHAELSRNNSSNFVVIEIRSNYATKTIEKKSTRYANNDCNIKANTSGFSIANNAEDIFTQSGYGLANTVITGEGNFFKETKDFSGAKVYSLFNSENSELKNYWYNGGELSNKTFDLFLNTHLKSGVYYIDAINRANILNSPPTNDGYGLVVASSVRQVYYMIAFNRHGIWCAESGGPWVTMVQK